MGSLTVIVHSSIRSRLRAALLRRSIGAGAAVLFLSGCYTYVPSSRAPLIGERVGVSLNDRGRAELAAQVGEAVDRIGGAVLEQDTTGYVLAVYDVKSLRSAASAKWTGEKVRVAADQVAFISERQLNKGRTAIAAGGAVAILITLFATVDVFGTGDPPIEGPTIPPIGDQARIPLVLFRFR